MNPQTISRTLSHLLRHRPEEYGLTLEPGGWVPLSEVLAALQRRGGAWARLQETDLRRAVEKASRGRHEISGTRIRALYGHSTEELPEAPAAAPPVMLYHGTSPEAALLIERQGLLPMSRTRVHLGAGVEEALRVGRRHSEAPVILRIRALEAHQAGVSFFPGSERIWTSEAIPPEFIERLPPAE